MEQKVRGGSFLNNLKIIKRSKTRESLKKKKRNKYTLISLKMYKIEINLFKNERNIVIDREINKLVRGKIIPCAKV